MPSVFIIESDADFARELDQALLGLGYQTHLLDDGNAVVRQAGDSAPDLFVLCAELPRLSGFSVCNRLKRDPKLQAIPVIIISANASEETFEQHRRLPKRCAQAYLHKPVAVETLLAQIAQLLGGEPTVDEASVSAPEPSPKRQPFESGVVIDSQSRRDETTEEFDLLLDGSLDDITIDEELLDSDLLVSVASEPAEGSAQSAPRTVEPSTDDAQGARMAELGAELARARQQHEEQARQAAERNQELSDQATTLHQELSRLAAEREALDGQCRHFEAEASRLASELQGAEERASDATGQLSAVREQSGAASGELEGLRSRLGEFELAKHGADEELAQREGELVAATEARASLERALAEEQAATREALAQLDAKNKQLERERDAALAEADEARTEFRELAGSLQSIQGQAAAEASRLAQERDAALARAEEASSALAAREERIARLESEQEALTNDKQAVENQRDALAGERDALAGERDALVSERDALISERDALAGERDALAGERDARAAELARLHQHTRARLDRFKGALATLAIELDSDLVETDGSVNQSS